MRRRHLNHLFRQLLASLVVTVNPGQDPGIRGEVLHQRGGNLGKVSGAPGASDVLVLGPVVSFTDVARIHGNGDEISLI